MMGSRPGPLNTSRSVPRRSSSVALLVFARPGDGPDRLSGGARRRFDATIRLARSVGKDIDVLVSTDAAGRARLPAEARVLEQVGEGFERRFLGALEAAFACGYTRVVAIGSDTPDLTARDLRRACRARERVLGPSLDGGVYLLGLDPDAVDLLRGAPWCTDQLARDLGARLGSIRWLLPRRDIDRPEDCLLVAFRPCVRPSPGQRPGAAPRRRPAGLHGSGSAVLGRGPPASF